MSTVYWVVRVVGLISVAVASFYMVKVRKTNSSQDAAIDGLTGAEFVLVLLTMIFGGVVVVGLIYYHGWKNRFPRKARQILELEGALIVLFVVGVILAMALVTRIAVQSGEKKGQQSFETALSTQQSDVTKQLQSLATGSTTPQTGPGFSIDVPTGWGESPEDEAQWAQNFGQSKVWKTDTALATVLSGEGTAHQELDVVWNQDVSTGSLAKSESLDVGDASNWPDQYTVSHPSFAGASKATLIVPTSINADSYTMKMYVHGKGTIFFIEGTFDHGTDAEVLGMKKVFTSLHLQ